MKFISAGGAGALPAEAVPDTSETQGPLPHVFVFVCSRLFWLSCCSIGAREMFHFCVRALQLSTNMFKNSSPAKMLPNSVPKEGFKTHRNVLCAFILSSVARSGYERLHRQRGASSQAKTDVAVDVQDRRRHSASDSGAT